MNAPAGRSLAGRTILNTRARGQASALSEALERLGARVVEVPTIEFTDPMDWEPADSAIRQIETFDWIVFTSVNGVERFFERLARATAAGLEGEGEGEGEVSAGLIGRLSRARIAAIGPATAQAVKRRGLFPEIVPAVFRGEELAASLPLRELAGRRVLIARAEKGRETLPESLAQAGAQVVVAACYRTIKPEVDVAALEARLAGGEIDLVTFSSSSTVENFVSLFPPERAAGLLSSVPVACIGPITAETARSCGIEPVAVSSVATIEGLVDTIVGLLSRPQS